MPCTVRCWPARAGPDEALVRPLSPEAIWACPPAPQAQVSPAPKSLAGGLGRRHSIRLAAGEPSRRGSTRTVIARASQERHCGRFTRVRTGASSVTSASPAGAGQRRAPAMRVNPSHPAEEHGMRALQNIIAGELGWFFAANPMPDYGIDAEAEVVIDDAGHRPVAGDADQGGKLPLPAHRWRLDLLRQQQPPRVLARALPARHRRDRRRGRERVLGGGHDRDHEGDGKELRAEDPPQPAAWHAPAGTGCSRSPAAARG